VALCLAAPLLLALFNLLLGKDANWDFLNYRWYNPFAFLQGRLGVDVAVAHHATYYNPLVDLPFYLAARALPARAAGFLLALVQGLNFIPLFGIAWIALPLDRARLRLMVATLLALAGMAGGGVLGQLGVVASDTLVSLGVLGALWLTVWKMETLLAAHLPLAMLWAAAAGLAAGAAAGLKLTAALFCVGLCLGFLALPAPAARRLALALAFGLGVLGGLALLTLPWSLPLWRWSGNPFFPYFNGWFRSPLISTDFNRDMAFIPDRLQVRLLFPFYFSFNSLRVAEFHFRDLRLLLVYLLLPAALCLPRLPRFRGRGAPFSPAARFLLAGAALSYLVWLYLFCIYRYILPLEMLAPLLLALCLGRLPIAHGTGLGLLALLLLGSQLYAYSGFDQRRFWGERYVEVRVPPIPRPAETLVLITGTSPLGVVIPQFPEGMAFLRIQSHMTGGEPPNGLDREMRRRVAAHRGDLLLLHHPGERAATQSALTAYRLALDRGRCRNVLSNVGPSLLLCTLRRLP
jgi:hypothetical protein